MDTAKEQVQQILATLPEDASLEDIQYHIYVRQKIQQGVDDVDAGRTISHAEVQRRLAKWLTK
jgi:predicted transcriptional regulator